MKSLEMGYRCSMLGDCCVAFGVVSHSDLWIRFCPIMVELSKLKLHRMCPKSCQHALSLTINKLLPIFILSYPEPFGLHETFTIRTIV